MYFFLNTAIQVYLCVFNVPQYIFEIEYVENIDNGVKQNIINKNKMLTSLKHVIT